MYFHAEPWKGVGTRYSEMETILLDGFGPLRD